MNDDAYFIYISVLITNTRLNRKQTHLSYDCITSKMVLMGSVRPRSTVKIIIIILIDDMSV